MPRSHSSPWSLTYRQNIHIKEWTAYAGSENTGDPDYIVVVTDPMYTTAAGANRKTDRPDSRKKRKVLSGRSVPTKPEASSSKTSEAYDEDDMDLGFGDDCEAVATKPVRALDDSKKKCEFYAVSMECAPNASSSDDERFVPPLRLT